MVSAWPRPGTATVFRFRLPATVSVQVERLIPISAVLLSPPNIWSMAAMCARCTRSRDTPIRRWSGVMSTRLCAVSLGHGSFWRRGKAWGNARGDQRSDRSGRDVRQDNSEVRRGSPRTAGAILVIARIRLTRTIRANTVVGAKHPIPVVPQTHEGRQRMFRPYRGSQ